MFLLIPSIPSLSGGARRLWAFDQVLVSHRGAGTILRYASDGTLLGEFGGPELVGANGMKLGPDGMLYVADEALDHVLRYDPITEQFLGSFADGGGLSFPVGITFGPDNDLYVSSCNNDSVKRYDGETGDFVSTFAVGGGLNCPIQPTFGTDGDLFVTGVFNNAVTRYDGTTGQFKEVFASGNGISRAVALEFGPDGNLYVGSQNTQRIKRFDGQTGGTLLTISSSELETRCSPEQIHFSPDGSMLYVSDLVTGSILRYDAGSGQFLDFS